MSENRIIVPNAQPVFRLPQEAQTTLGGTPVKYTVDTDIARGIPINDNGQLDGNMLLAFVHQHEIVVNALVREVLALRRAIYGDTTPEAATEVPE